MNMDASNYPEITAVAEMLSFKIVQHHIRAGAARLAVGQFKTHMRWFRHAVGPPALVSRLLCWLPVLVPNRVVVCDVSVSVVLCMFRRC